MASSKSAPPTDEAKLRAAITVVVDQADPISASTVAVDQADPISASTVMAAKSRMTAPTVAPTVSAVTVNPEQTSAAAVEAPKPIPVVELPPRYRDLGLIASGGFGEVRRVHDTELERDVAMKILRSDIAERARIKARFMAEARLTAGLDHPGIVAVHDWGELGDGRLWFTMREVRGRTLGAVIRQVHSAQLHSAQLHSSKGDAQDAQAWTFRRLVDAFARMCQAVAYAHRRGVVHRDLKPDNVMVGELGEVLVMDWGLGKRVGDSEAEKAGGASLSSAQMTQQGDVLGTPAYMPPEQARGLPVLHGPPSDVYGLGAILYYVLAGRPPYQGGSAYQVLAQVLRGPPVAVTEATPGKSFPAELAVICSRAMSREIADRYPDAEALATEIVAWLDGARRREQALAVIAKARAMEPQIASRREKARRCRAQAQVLLDRTQPYDPVDDKLPGWALEDEAEQLDVATALREAEWLEAMQGALMIDPELPEAHAALANYSKERFLDAERNHRHTDAARFEASLRTHDRGQYAALLRGEGALTLVTDPPGEVLLERYETERRRLVARPVRSLGQTPLRAVPLSKGSYRLRIRAPGRSEVLYPVHIERGDHWDGCAPGDAQPYPIVLPEEGALAADEVYVPAGWCWIGGDPEAGDSLPLQRVWVDGFAIQKFPVTNRQWLVFLNDLVAIGREEQAEDYCPRAPASGPNSVGEAVYGRDRFGQYVLAAVNWDAWGRPWHLDWPVVLIHWHAARAYASWAAAQVGQALRLPNELEREKAARGTDRRHLPWGYHFDATWACIPDSHPGDPTRVTVYDYPLDQSPYGVRGLAGNVRDWCANVWMREGPALHSGKLIRMPADAASEELRSIRGGSWFTPSPLSRSAIRFASRPGRRWRTTGLRLARSL